MAVDTVGPFSYYETASTQDDFRGGLSVDAPVQRLRKDELRAALNVITRESGQLQLRRGQRTLGASRSSFPVQGFTRFRNATTVKRLEARVGHLWARNESDESEVDLGLVGSLTNRFEFATIYDRAFWVDGLSDPKTWDGTTITTIGIAAPLTALTATGTLTVGLPNTQNLTPYQYYVTYLNARGVESNPSPISDPLDVHNAVINLSAIPISPDTSVTKRRIYRVGGTVGVALMLKEIPNNTATTSTDNTSDLTLTDIPISFSRDQPPAGCSLISKWKNRLVMVNGTTVMVSNLGQPDYFPLTVTNALVDGKRFDLDPDLENPPVALGSSGSELLIICAKNAWLFAGDNEDNFTFVKAADIGCVARRSLVHCGNIAVWLAPDRQVWALEPDGPRCLTHLKLEKLLEGVPEASLPNACAAYFRYQYHLCIPQAGTNVPSVYLVYDFRTGAWTDHSAVYTNATQLYSETGVSDSNELLMATAIDFKDLAGSSYQGIVAAYGLTSVTDVAFDIWSGEMEFGKPAWEKLVYMVRVFGSITPKAATTPTFTLYAHAHTPTDRGSKVYNLTGAGGVLLTTTVDPGLMGQRWSWRIQGQASAMQIESVEIWPIFLREANI